MNKISCLPAGTSLTKRALYYSCHAETKLGGSEPVVNKIKKPLLQNLVDFVEFKGNLRSV